MVVAIADPVARATDEDECGGSESTNARFVRPTLDEVVAQIAYEMVCGPLLAQKVIDWVAGLTDMARASDDGTIIVPDTVRRMPEYLVFDKMAPHGTAAPRPGTAWDLLTRHLIVPGNDESGLVHDKVQTACVYRVTYGVSRPFAA